MSGCRRLLSDGFAVLGIGFLQNSAGGNTSFAVIALLLLGVSPSLVSQIELGRVQPSLGTLYSIANPLVLTLDDLFREGEASCAGRFNLFRCPDASPPVGHRR